MTEAVAGRDIQEIDKGANVLIEATTAMVVAHPTPEQLAAAGASYGTPIIIIEDDAQQVRVVELATQLNGNIADTEGYFDPIVRKAKATWDEAIAQRKRAVGPRAGWLAVLKSALNAYAQIVENRRLEAERLANIEARKKEEASRVQTAALLESEGAHEEAAEVLATPGDVRQFRSAPSSQEIGKVKGAATKEVFTAEVKDFKKLVAAVAAGSAPIECLAADESALNRLAKTFKRPGGTEIYPGVVSVRTFDTAVKKGVR